MNGKIILFGMLSIAAICQAGGLQRALDMQVIQDNEIAAKLTRLENEVVVLCNRSFISVFDLAVARNIGARASAMQAEVEQIGSWSDKRQYNPRIDAVINQVKNLYIMYRNLHPRKDPLRHV